MDFPPLVEQCQGIVLLFQRHGALHELFQRNRAVDQLREELVPFVLAAMVPSCDFTPDRECQGFAFIQIHPGFTTN